MWGVVHTYQSIMWGMRRSLATKHTRLHPSLRDPAHPCLFSCCIASCCIALFSTPMSSSPRLLPHFLAPVLTAAGRTQTVAAPRDGGACAVERGLCLPPGIGRTLRRCRVRIAALNSCTCAHANCARTRECKGSKWATSTGLSRRASGQHTH